MILLPADLPIAEPACWPVRRQRPGADRPPGARRPAAAGPQVGFAGIAKPWKVERALKAAGCHLVDFAPFPDHAPMTRRP
jgi:tetraacyldisaccharide 4'-kinase